MSAFADALAALVNRFGGELEALVESHAESVITRPCFSVSDLPCLGLRMLLHVWLSLCLLPDLLLTARSCVLDSSSGYVTLPS